MDRDTLKEFGLDEELIEKVMREHGKVVNSLKDEKSTIEQELESEKTKAVGLSEQIEERNEQLEKIKNENKNVEGLQETINQLKQSNSQKEEELKNQVSDTKRKYEIKLGLQKAKARNEKSVLANLDEEAITLDEEGNLVGCCEKIKNENKNVEGLQETINQLKQSNSQKEEELKNQVSDTKRKYEIKLGLQKAKARNEKSVLANLDEEAITLDEEGNLVGFWEQIEKVKESDSYLFEDENSGGQSHSSGSVDYIAGNP